MSRSNRKSYNLLTIAKFLVSREALEEESDSEDSMTDDGRADHQAAIVRWFIRKLGHKRRSENLLFGLNCYLVAPLQYIYIPKIINIPFPTTSELKNISWKFPTGVSEDLIAHLGRRLNNMPPGSKYINLYIDELPLTSRLFFDITGDEVTGYQDIDGVRNDEVATKAFVIVMNSCAVKLHMPLGYIFTSETPKLEDISQWVDKVIKQLSHAGYHICAIISKQTATFDSLAKLKGITAEKPYFEVERNRTFYIFEPEYVIMDIRDMLITTDLHYGGDKIASWNDIINYNNTKYLIDGSIPNIKSREWYLAVQLFKTFVAVAIGDFKLENGTANLIYQMSNFLELARNPKYKREYIGNKKQVECLKNLLEIFESMEAPKTSDPVLKCIEGIQITLNGIIQMWEHFSPMGLKSVIMAKLSMNIPNKILKEIKKLSANSQPTPLQFKRAFSKNLMQYVISNSVKFDCDESLLKYLKGAKMPSLFKNHMPGKAGTSPLVVHTKSYRLKPQDGCDQFKHSCIYLLKRCQGIHSCPDLNNCEAEKFMLYVQHLDDALKQTIKETFVQKGVGKNLLDKLLQAHNHNMQPCKCFPVKDLIKLFLRMNIYDTIRQCNGDIVTGETEPKQKKRKCI